MITLLQGLGIVRTDWISYVWLVGLILVIYLPERIWGKYARRPA